MKYIFVGWLIFNARHKSQHRTEKENHKVEEKQPDLDIAKIRTQTNAIAMPMMLTPMEPEAKSINRHLLELDFSSSVFVLRSRLLPAAILLDDTKPVRSKHRLPWAPLPVQVQKSRKCPAQELDLDTSNSWQESDQMRPSQLTYLRPIDRAGHVQRFRPLALLLMVSRSQHSDQVLRLELPGQTFVGFVKHWVSQRQDRPALSEERIFHECGRAATTTTPYNLPTLLITLGAAEEWIGAGSIL
jgi:hypothetical protein